MGTDAQQPSEDLGASLERASRCARRGDLDGLEGELSKLRRLGHTVDSFATTLRRIANSVRAHPTYRAGGEQTARAV